jgi:hypothetical protein
MSTSSSNIRKRSSFRTVYALFGLFLIVLLRLSELNEAKLQNFVSFAITDNERNQTQTSATASLLQAPSSSGQLNSLRVCPHTQHLFNHSDLLATITEAYNFHVKGGNLASVMNFKNNAVDDTLKGMKLEFQVSTNDKHEAEVIKTDYVNNIMRLIKKKGDPRGGYGQPLPGRFVPDMKPLLNENRRVDVTEPFDEQRWRASEGPKTSCLSITKLSGSRRKYEDKWICGDVHNCTVISIGSNDQWGLETALKEYGCVTHTFDCTLKNNEAKNRPLNSPNMHFYPYCISSSRYVDTAMNRSYVTYRDMIEMTEMKTPPTLLKMDIEGFEFEVLAKMIQDDYLLPMQIQVEQHFATRMVDVSWMFRTLTSAELALFSSMMFVSGGYLPVHRVDACAVCLEVLYVRAMC